jgi:hypothetical protein
MSDTPKKDITRLLRERTEVDRALARAIQQALWEHKQLGHPVVIWRDGKVVWLPPEEIQVEKPPE